MILISEKLSNVPKISFCLFSQRTTWSKKSAKIYKNAQYHVRMKKYKTAKLLLKDAIRIDNTFIEAWISLGEINFILDQKKEAIDVYNHILNINFQLELEMGL